MNDRLEEILYKLTASVELFSMTEVEYNDSLYAGQWDTNVDLTNGAGEVWVNSHGRTLYLTGGENCWIPLFDSTVVNLEMSASSPVPHFTKGTETVFFLEGVGGAPFGLDVWPAFFEDNYSVQVVKIAVNKVATGRYILSFVQISTAKLDGEITVSSMVHVEVRLFLGNPLQSDLGWFYVNVSCEMAEDPRTTPSKRHLRYDALELMAQGHAPPGWVYVDPSAKPPPPPPTLTFEDTFLNQVGTPSDWAMWANQNGFPLGNDK